MKNGYGKEEYPRPQRRCIVCGGTPVTGEHLFSIWIGDLVPKTAARHMRTVRAAMGTGDQLDRPYLDQARRLEGDIKSSRLRTVCKRCNNEWMSAIESAAKPVMTPLILGQLVVLPP